MPGITGGIGGRLSRAASAVAGIALAASPPAPVHAPGAIVLDELIDATPPYLQAHASTIVELPDGTIAAAWFGGSEEGAADVAIWFARRTGGRWSRPVAVADGCHNGRCEPTWNPVLFRAPGVPLRLFYKVGRDPRHWRGMVIASVDGGGHWTQPAALPASVLGPIKNKPVIAPDGGWLAPSSRERGSGRDPRWTLHIERSTDRGRSWIAGPAIASPARLAAIQPTILTLANGRLELLARTRQGVIAASWSSDAGRHWSPLVAMTLPNPNSGIDAVTLRDGRHLLVYNPRSNAPEHPDYGPRWPLSVALSNDGTRWRGVLTLAAQPLPEGYAYPAVIQTRDGLVHVTFTQNRTRIRHIVIDPARVEGQQ